MNGETNKQLDLSEELYCGIFKHTSDYAYDFRVEPDGTLVCECVTEAFASITGYTLEEVNERGGWLSLIHPDDIPIFIRQLDQLFSGQSNISEFRIVTKGGEVRWLRDYAQPIWGEAHGRVIRIYGTSVMLQNESSMRNGKRF